MQQRQRTTSFRNRRRNPYGQAIVEGTVAICLMILMVICFITLMLFVGSAMYYTNQLTYISQQAAVYGMNQMYYAGLRRSISPGTAESNTQTAIQPLLDAAGLPDATVEFKIVNNGGINYGEATVTCSKVPMLGGGISILGNLLPKSLTLSQKAMALETDSVPPFIAEIAATAGPDSATGCVQVPCVAAGSPWNGGSPSYYGGSIGVPGAAVTDAPGYVGLLIQSPSNNVFARAPFSAGPDWAY